MTRNGGFSLFEVLPRIVFPRRRPGLSRLDLVGVCGVVALLFGLISPFALETRESARRLQCQDNLRRLGMAMHAYHDQFASLPPASFWDEAELVLDVNMRPAREPENVLKSKANWVQLLLPFAGLDEAARRLTPSLPITDKANRAARTLMLPLMTCPTDNYSVADNPYVLTTRDGESFKFARGNYAINGGTQTNATWPGRLSFPIPDGNMITFRSATSDFQWWGNGVAGFNRCFSFKDFTNGLSTTAMLDEIRAGIVPDDSRGVWALGQIGSSVTWAHGVNSDDYGPNNQWQDSDDILDGRAIAAKYGMQRFFDARLPFCAHCRYSNQATARSLHEAGVNVLMADGSNRFIADAVSPSLWHVMHSRETPADVLEGLQDSDLVEGQRAGPPDVSGSQVASADKKGGPSPQALQAVDRAVVVNSLGMKLAPIAPGQFIMGLPDEGNSWPFPEWDVKPHTVDITRRFYIGVHEVTQQQFQTVMGSNPSWHAATGGGAPLVRSLDTARLPVENMTWREAAEFCKRLSDRSAEAAAGRSYRLPTEAEWEYVCRSGSSEAHRFIADWTGVNTLDELAGKEKHPTKEPLVPTPVGSYPPNAFGVCDMRGNVFEWTADWFDRTYYAHSPPNDPTGPSTGFLKVVRGWDWTFIGPQCKDFQFMTPPWKRNQYIGFRVVCEMSQVAAFSGSRRQP
jgi:formylglycine-generating enzyme required for sulfatase activity